MVFTLAFWKEKFYLISKFLINLYVLDNGEQNCLHVWADRSVCRSFRRCWFIWQRTFLENYTMKNVLQHCTIMRCVIRDAIITCRNVASWIGEIYNMKSHFLVQLCSQWYTMSWCNVVQNVWQCMQLIFTCMQLILSNWRLVLFWFQACAESYTESPQDACVEARSLLV